MSDDRNPMAFPRPSTDHGSYGSPGQDGMILRDYFAGQCDIRAYGPGDAYEAAYGRRPTISELAAFIAKIRMIEADAMLAARQEPTS